MLTNKNRKQGVFNDVLFAFLALWTAVQMTLGIAEYLKLGWVIPALMPFANAIILAAYVARKELDRWSEHGNGKKRGEAIFFAWWTLLFLMFIGNGACPYHWDVPPRVVECCLYVLAVFVAADLSKALHRFVAHRRQSVRL